MSTQTAAPAHAWGRVALVSGIIAGVGLLAGTALFLLDATDVLAASPEYRSTSAGLEADLATYYVAFFERQHEILWSIALRDTIFPVAFVALMVAGLAAAVVTGPWRPDAALTALFFVVGGTLHAVNDVTYLGAAEYWRSTGWSADPPGPMVAVGRSAEAIELSTQYVEAVSYLVLAAGMVSLGRLAAARVGLPAWLGLLAYLEAVGLALLVVALAFPVGWLFEVAGLATGVVLGPAVAIALGLSVSRAASRSHPEVASTGSP